MNTFDSYAKVKRAIGDFVRNTGKARERAHELLQSALYHGLTTRDYSLVNDLLRVMPDSHRRFMVIAIKETITRATLTIKNWMDGNGNPCYVNVNKSSKAVHYEDAEEIAAVASALPFYWNLYQADKAKKAADRKAAAEKRAIEKAHAKKEAEKVEAETLHGEGIGTVHIRSALFEVEALIKGAQSNGTLALSDRNLASQFLTWAAKSLAAPAEDLKQAA